MRVSDVIEMLYKLPQDSEIAIDWVTRREVELLSGRTLSHEEWENAVADWQMNDYDEDALSVTEQLRDVVDSRAVMAEQNRNYYNDLGVK